MAKYGALVHKPRCALLRTTTRSACSSWLAPKRICSQRRLAPLFWSVGSGLSVFPHLSWFKRMDWISKSRNPGLGKKGKELGWIRVWGKVAAICSQPKTALLICKVGEPCKISRQVCKVYAYIYDSYITTFTSNIQYAAISISTSPSKCNYNHLK